MSDRKTRLSLMAKAPHKRLLSLWHEMEEAPQFDQLRAPEIGTVMVQGRAGATGAPFNLGEMTVTRCSVRLRGSNAVGHGYVQGRSHQAAQVAALIDAMAEAGEAQRIEAAILEPLSAQSDTTRDLRAAKAAATKVEFFTMVRGDS